MGAAATPEHIDQVANNPGGLRLIVRERNRIHFFAKKTKRMDAFFF
jgi:hypothetical protein